MKRQHNVAGFIVMLGMAIVTFLFSLVAASGAWASQMPYRSFEPGPLGRVVCLLQIPLGILPFVILFRGHVNLWWVVPCMLIVEMLLMGLFIRVRATRTGPDEDIPGSAGVPSEPRKPVPAGSERLRFPSS